MRKDLEGGEQKEVAYVEYEVAYVAYEVAYVRTWSAASEKSAGDTAMMWLCARCSSRICCSLHM